MPAPRITACAVYCQPVYFRGRGSGFIVIQRSGPPAAGGWAFPGGWIESGETPEEAAAREMLEETGLSLPLPRLLWSRHADEGFPIIFCKGNDVLDWEKTSQLTVPQYGEVMAVSWSGDLIPRLCFQTHQQTLDSLMGNG